MVFLSIVLLFKGILICHCNTASNGLGLPISVSAYLYRICFHSISEDYASFNAIYRNAYYKFRTSIWYFLAWFIFGSEEKMKPMFYVGALIILSTVIANGILKQRANIKKRVPKI